MSEVKSEAKSRYTDILEVSPLADGVTWVLRKEFGYDIGQQGSEDTIDVPLGFMTDFASIPRIFRFLVSKWGKHGNAAVLHDYCYWAQDRSREESDRIFKEAYGGLQNKGLAGVSHLLGGKTGRLVCLE